MRVFGRTQSVFVGAVFVAALLAGLLVGSSPVTQISSDRQSHEKWYDKQSYYDPLIDFWNWATADSISVYTAIIMVFTGILTGFAWLQVRQTKVLQRAYISVEGLGIEPLGPEIESVAHLSIRNRGRLPARDVSWSITHKLCTNGARTDFPIREKFYGGKLVIPPDTEMRRSQNCKFTQKEFDLFAKVPREAFFYIWGEIKYTDGLRTKRFTKFCHRYDSRGIHPLPADRSHGGHFAISGESMRMHQYGNDAD